MIPTGLQWPLACALVALIASGAGFFVGRYTAHQSAALRAAEGQVENIKQREDITHEIERLDDPAFGAELDRWLSGPQR